jgi:hypothetical protein
MALLPEELHKYSEWKSNKGPVMASREPDFPKLPESWHSVIVLQIECENIDDLRQERYLRYL